MGQVTYSFTNEVNLDHERICEYCGKKFNVIFRKYVREESTKSTGIISAVLNTQERTEKRLQETVQAGSAEVIKNQPQLEYNQRCTNCGKYDSSALERMADSYSEHKLKRFTFLGCSWIFLLAIEFIYIMVIKTENIQDMLPFTITTAAIVLALPLATYFIKPFSRKMYEMQIHDANNPEKTEAWLKNWQNKSPEFLRMLRNPNVSVREGAFEELLRVKRFKDPVHEEVYNKKRVKRK